MDLAALRTRAKNRFRDSSGLILPDPLWTEHINAAYRHFLRAARWPFLVAETTVNVTAGTRLVPVDPSVLAGLENVLDNTTHKLLQPMPPLPWRFRIYLESHGSGVPAMFEVIGQNLYLIPAPAVDSVLKVFWYEDPPDLALDADEPVIPLRYQEALVAGAIAKASTDDLNPESAATYQEEFESVVTQAVQELFHGAFHDAPGFVQSAGPPGTGVGTQGSGGAGSGPALGETRLD